MVIFHSYVKLLEVSQSVSRFFLPKKVVEPKPISDEESDVVLKARDFGRRMKLSSGWEGAKERGVPIFPIYSLFNGEPSYLELPSHLIEIMMEGHFMGNIQGKLISLVSNQ